jgi:hypothetical protein
MRWNGNQRQIAESILKHRDENSICDVTAVLAECGGSKRNVLRILKALREDNWQIPENESIDAAIGTSEVANSHPSSEEMPTADTIEPNEKEKSKVQATKGTGKAAAKRDQVAIASSVVESQRVIIRPKQAVIGSTLFWLAKEAAINLWSWPNDISDEDFLDSFLYLAFKQRGIILGAYVEINKKEETNRG